MSICCTYGGMTSSGMIKTVLVRTLVGLVLAYLPVAVAEPGDGEGLQGPEVVCAASDTKDALKRHAKYVCDAADARPKLQAAINEAARLGVRCLLLKGTYVLDSRGEMSPKGCLYFPNRTPEGKVYAHNGSQFNVLEGATMPLGWLGGVQLLMGRNLYDSIRDDETFSLLYCVGHSIFGRAWKLRNLAIRLPDTQKPVVAVDGRFASALEYENLWVSGFDPREVDYRSATGIKMPHPRSVGIRGCAGSNYYAMTTWRNLAVDGFGTGFDIGGEHVYCESLSALYNVYGFAFDCYKGKKSINLDDSAKACGGCHYPVTCVNLLDEHNVHMPRFGVASHGGVESIHPNGRQSITIRGMNIQWPNTCPGHTDRRHPDFLKGRHRATEELPGTWRGTVEYVIDWTTPGCGVNLVNDPFFEKGHGDNVVCRNLQCKPAGTSNERRAITRPNRLQQFFDTDLGKMLVFDGASWRDGNGMEVK